MPFFAERNSSSCSESPHFPAFLQNVANAKFEQRDDHGQSRNGKLFCKVCGNPDYAKLDELLDPGFLMRQYKGQSHIWFS